MTRRRVFGASWGVRLPKWPPLPKGRRPRRMERERRALVAELAWAAAREQDAARDALLEALLQRNQRRVGPLLSVLVARVVELMPPEPLHGRRCRSLHGGCSECRAIQRWRDTFGRFLPAERRYW